MVVCLCHFMELPDVLKGKFLDMELLTTIGSNGQFDYLDQMSKYFL